MKSLSFFLLCCHCVLACALLRSGDGRRRQQTHWSTSSRSIDNAEGDKFGRRLGPAQKIKDTLRTKGWSSLRKQDNNPRQHLSRVLKSCNLLNSSPGTLNEVLEATKVSLIDVKSFTFACNVSSYPLTCVIIAYR